MEAGYDVVGVDGALEARAELARKRKGARVEPSAVALPDAKNQKKIGFICGDFLETSDADLGGPFDAAWDRGGLVAVDPRDRPAYAAALARHVRPGGRVLVVAVEHAGFGDGANGPPFALGEAELTALVGGHFDVAVLEREDRTAAEPAWRERGCAAVHEVTYLLARKAPPARAAPLSP